MEEALVGAVSHARPTHFSPSTSLGSLVQAPFLLCPAFFCFDVQRLFMSIDFLGQHPGWK